jgi:hypothetical protein
MNLDIRFVYDVHFITSNWKIFCTVGEMKENDKHSPKKMARFSSRILEKNPQPLTLNGCYSDAE